MEKKQKRLYVLLIVSTLAIVCSVAFFYIKQLNNTISDNTTSSVSEIAEHDKAAIESYIQTCWEDLGNIHERLSNHDCKTLDDVKTRMKLESASSRFSHIYLLAQDGTVYTDQYTTYRPKDGNTEQQVDFRSYFPKNRDKVVERFESHIPGIQSGQSPEASILYGIRLKDYQIDGQTFFALIGISDSSSIQSNMVIDSFIKDGQSRGHSALIDMQGNYIVNINKKVYLNEQNNLFRHLSESEDSELTNEEVAEKLKKSETFSFYHSHVGEKYQELFYFIPFGDEVDLYFIMSLNEVVFAEQSRTFVTMSMTMLIVSILAVIAMLLAAMRLQRKSIHAAEKAKSQKEFLSNMSHEIRTPLNGLVGLNHLMLACIDDNGQKPQIREWLKKSHSTAGYLLSLVNDILDMSKLQAGKVDLINEPLLVSTLIDEITAMQTDNIKSRGVNFTVEKDLSVPCIEGDATRLKQILMNIVGNAAKFTPKGGSIRLSVSQSKTDEYHVITSYRCEDTGIGMSKEYLDKIFDSFSQERNRTTDEIKGTGLGMAISKRLANAMGGDIMVESELNAGSTFTVSIPSAIVTDVPDYLKERDTMLTVESNKPSDEENPRHPIKVLVVEDVALNAEVLLEILDMEGIETEHAQNGKEAIDIFEQSAEGEFDIILMDMQMPIMDGCTACRQIRNLDRADAKSVVIYACTANTFQEDRDLALASGMDDFLIKPVDVNVLLKKMKKRNKYK